MKQKGFSPIIIVLMVLTTLFVVAKEGYRYYYVNDTEVTQNSGRPNNNKTGTTNFLYPDLSGNEDLVGMSHNIFVGKIIKLAGTSGGRGTDETAHKQFEVKVLSNIKGDLSGLVLVNIMDTDRGVSSDGGAKLSIGATYLLATRYRQQNNSYTLLEVSHGWKLLSADSTLSDSELIDLAQKDTRVRDLRIAYPNEIVSEGEIKAGFARNRFLSLPQEKQDQLRAEAEKLKSWWPW
jgi:hypothetical protein